MIGLMVNAWNPPPENRHRWDGTMTDEPTTGAEVLATFTHPEEWTDVHEAALDVDYLFDEQLDDDDPVRLMHEAITGWHIDGDKTAAWALARLQMAHDRLGEAEAVAMQLVEVARRYEAEACARPARDVAFFEAKLEAYYRRLVADGKVGRGGKNWTHVAPGGKLKSTAGGVSTLVTDEAAAVEWLEDHAPGLVNYPDPKVDKAEAKKLLGAKVSEEPDVYPAMWAETGEAVPGIEFERAARSFKLELDAKADEG